MKRKVWLGYFIGMINATLIFAIKAIVDTHWFGVLLVVVIGGLVGLLIAVLDGKIK